jgi:hypothetical protein
MSGLVSELGGRRGWWVGEKTGSGRGIVGGAVAGSLAAVVVLKLSNVCSQPTDQPTSPAKKVESLGPRIPQPTRKISQQVQSTRAHRAHRQISPSICCAAAPDRELFALPHMDRCPSPFGSSTYTCPSSPLTCLHLVSQAVRKSTGHRPEILYLLIAPFCLTKNINNNNNNNNFQLPDASLLFSAARRMHTSHARPGQRARRRRRPVE